MSEDALPCKEELRAMFKEPRGACARCGRGPCSRSSALWKRGNEFALYHPSASHVPPEYRDGWNRCYAAAIAKIRELEQRDVPLKMALEAMTAALHRAEAAEARVAKLEQQFSERAEAFEHSMQAAREQISAAQERVKRIAESAEAVVSGGADKIDFFKVPSHLIAALALVLDDAAMKEQGSC